MTMVYDSRRGHSINLRDYDAPRRMFTYWDQWATGSFLAPENNCAGVSARAHPIEPRLWLLRSDELQEVVHASLVRISDWSRLPRRQ